MEIGPRLAGHKFAGITKRLSICKRHAHY